MTVFDDPKFLKLKAQFYAELKLTGFKDIENKQEQLTDHQGAYDFSQRIGFKTDLISLTVDYYRWAEHMVSSGHFKSEVDRAIWLLHAEGKSSRYIGSKVGLEQTWICRKILKIKNYLKAQASKRDEYE